MNGRPSAQVLGVAFAHSMGITGDGSEALRQLRALPAEKILNGLNMASMQAANSTYAGPMIDGKLIVGQTQTLYREGKYQHVPFVVGANSMDIGFSSAKTKEGLFAHSARMPRPRRQPMAQRRPPTCAFWG